MQEITGKRAKRTHLEGNPPHLRHIGQPGWWAPGQGGSRWAHRAGATPSMASHVTDPRDTSRSPSKASKAMSV